MWRWWKICYCNGKTVIVMAKGQTWTWQRRQGQCSTPGGVFITILGIDYIKLYQTLCNTLMTMDIVAGNDDYYNDYNDYNGNDKKCLGAFTSSGAATAPCHAFTFYKKKTFIPGLKKKTWQPNLFEGKIYFWKDRDSIHYIYMGCFYPHCPPLSWRGSIWGRADPAPRVAILVLKINANIFVSDVTLVSLGVPENTGKEVCPDGYYIALCQAQVDKDNSSCLTTYHYWQHRLLKVSKIHHLVIFLHPIRCQHISTWQKWTCPCISHSDQDSWSDQDVILCAFLHHCKIYILWNSVSQYPQTE